jgi:hypothetical protein
LLRPLERHTKLVVGRENTLKIGITPRRPQRSPRLAADGGHPEDRDRERQPTN